MSAWEDSLACGMSVASEPEIMTNEIARNQLDLVVGGLFENAKTYADAKWADNLDLENHGLPRAAKYIMYPTDFALGAFGTQGAK